MNYLRGAVSAFSAPYQYYKDLNPSTLTGAIDVIVVSRPTEDGSDTELVCSPFHVRFGKWQVLRPGDKKVNLTINGRPIPFNMKVGEAGEAFFVFETAGDIPDDLITSPLLSAAQSPNIEPRNEDVGVRVMTVEGTPLQNHSITSTSSQEPDFLDLDATGREPTTNLASGISLSKPDNESNTEVISPSSLLSRAKTIGADAINAVELGVEETEAVSKMTLNSLSIVGNNADGVLTPNGSVEVATPEPMYTDDVVIDLDGYHSHNKERSDRTIISRDAERSSADRTPGHSTRSSSPAPFAPSSSSPTISTIPIPFPNIRATSEPPPDSSQDSQYPIASGSSHTRHESQDTSLRVSATDEYMWEWGAFPQKSATKTKFSDLPEPDISSWKGTTPSSFPNESLLSRSYSLITEPGFGIGGRLRPDREDPYIFTLLIEGKTVQFELSLVPVYRRRSPGSLGSNEVESAEIFNHSRLDFWRFIDDEQVLVDDDLVLRWGGDRYITRSDGSPLMDALSKWREATLHDKDTISASRSRSPSSAKEDDRYLGSKPSSPQNIRTSSTSWVRWWRRKGDPGESVPPVNRDFRPELRETCSVPPLAKAGSPNELPQIAANNYQRVDSTTPVPASDLSDRLTDDGFSVDVNRRPKKYAKTLRLTSEQLKLLDLKPGPNTVTFSLSATGAAACTARIFVWDHSDVIVVSDIDGTITKSDALGHVFTMIGRDWTHLGVAKLYTDICRNGYKIMYLTSRAIGQADSTRYYLKGIKQNDYQLPEGPVIMSPDRLMASLHREVIMRKPEVFKMACLRDIRRLFGETSINPFYSGFGNRITDALSYRSVDVPSSRIFTIDSTGEVKMELLELAGYKSSYIHMTDLVDQMFPPIHRRFNAHFTDFNYWKPPVQEYELPDLSPPSPALSARSDTSNQSTLARLRNISLIGSRSTNANVRQLSLTPPATESSGVKTQTERGRQQDTRDTHLKQMSSLERISRTLYAFAPSSSSTATSPTASSSTFFDSGDEDEGEEDGDLEKQKRRVRRESVPGPFDEMHVEEGETLSDNEYDYGYDGEHEDEAAEQAFDDDLFATGEMENVPFL